MLSKHESKRSSTSKSSSNYFERVENLFLREEQKNKVRKKEKSTLSNNLIRKPRTVKRASKKRRVES